MMNSRIRTVLLNLIGLLSFVFLSSCATPDQCIPFDKRISYPYQLEKSHNRLQIFPESIPSWWEPQLTKEQSQELHGTPLDIVAQDNHIWLASAGPGAPIALFNTDTGELEHYSISDISDQATIVNDLFLASDGTLWAAISLRDYQKNQSTLAFYDSEKDAFELVIDKNGLLTKRFYSWSSRDKVIAEGIDGHILVVVDGEIIAYNHLDNTAQKVFGLENDLEVWSIDVSQDGNIWFSAKDKPGLNEMNINTGEVSNHSIPPAVDYEGTVWSAFLIDSEESIWISNQGHLDPHPYDDSKPPVWSVIFPSPVFLHDRGGEWELMYCHPGRLYETSDGNIWFASNAGIIMLDRKNGEWCRKSPIYGLPTDDEDGNIWMTGGYPDHQIYHYQPR